jgi:GWxTD domain-containing protein
MKIHKITILFFLCLSIFTSKALLGQKIFIDENIKYWYGITSDLHVNHNMFADPDTIHILLEVNFNNGKIFDGYHYIYELHKSYHVLDIQQKDTINVPDHIVAIKANKIFLQIKLPFATQAELALIRITDKKTGIDYVYDIPLIKGYNFSSDGLVFYNGDGETPYLDDFAGVQQSLLLKSINEHNRPVFCFYYTHNFDEALPPMVEEDTRAGRNLTIDSVFMVSLNEPLTLTREGLYYFQKDSSSSNGVAIRVQDTYFPLVKTIEQVLAPLIYISTRAETDKIRNSPNQRQAFEEYWINLVKIPNLASSTVRQYYERVEAANYLFTTFKEGWKTDMGLIYIVFGPPDDVYKSEEIIDWVYNKDLTMPTIRFSFYKVKNVFTDHHYTLSRKKNYDKIWFSSVETWRKGKK